MHVVFLFINWKNFFNFLRASALSFFSTPSFSLPAFFDAFRRLIQTYFTAIHPKRTKKINFKTNLSCQFPIIHQKWNQFDYEIKLLKLNIVISYLMFCLDQIMLHDCVCVLSILHKKNLQKNNRTNI